MRFVPRALGDSKSFVQISFSGKPEAKPIPPEKLLADLLKRKVRQIVQDVTECPVDTLAAHLARLDDWRDVVELLLRHALAETPESLRSGKQLIYAVTLADWLAVAEITRREHRAPAFLNAADAELAQINHKLDLIGGFLAGMANVLTPEAFTNNEAESERT